MLKIVEVNDVEDLAQYRMVWNALFAGMPTATFFQSFDWLDTYWRHFGQQQKLRVLFVYSAGEAVGILPLCVRTESYGLSTVRVLSYPGDTVGTSHGPIGPNPAFTMLAAMQHIRRTPRDWDIIELRGVADEGLQGAKTARGLRAAGMFREIQEYQRSSVIDVPSTFGNVLADKSQQFPCDVECRWRDLVENEQVEYIRHRPLPASAGDGDPRWDLYSMCELAGLESWSRFATGRTLAYERLRNYLRAAHEVAARLGMLDLNLLLVDGRPAAFAYGYQRHGNITGLQTGACGSNCRELRLAVLLHMLNDSCRRGDRLIDLGPGADEHKELLRTRTEPTYQITFTPAGSWRSYAVRFSRWAKHRLPSAKQLQVPEFKRD